MGFESEIRRDLEVPDAQRDLGGSQDLVEVERGSVG